MVKRELKAAAYFDLYRIDLDFSGFGRFLSITLRWRVNLSPRTPFGGPNKRDSNHDAQSDQHAAHRRTIPHEVREEQPVWGDCGTKVMRWERKYDQGGAFIPIQGISTPFHDMRLDARLGDTCAVGGGKQEDRWSALRQFKKWKYEPTLANPRFEIYESLISNRFSISIS